MQADGEIDEFRTTFVREPGALQHHPALVLNADYRPLLLPAVALALAGGGQGGVARPGADRGGIRHGGAQPLDRDPHPLGGGAEGLRQAAEARGLHPVQPVPARRVLLPVLRREGRSDLRSRGAAGARRGDELGKRGRGLFAVQPQKGSRSLRQAGLSCASRRASPGRRSCATWAGSSRPTTCTTAGSTFSTGTPNWRPEGRDTGRGG
jgi:hypothetical protein